MHDHPAFSADKLHREEVVEAHLVDRLVALQGWRERRAEDHDRKLALDPDMLPEFVRASQPGEWARLEAQYPGRAREELLRNLAGRLQAVGTLEVLRKGITIIPGIPFRLCAFQPASGLNADLVRDCAADILSVTRQVRYGLKNENAIDVVLFVNGICVIIDEAHSSQSGQQATALADALTREEVDGRCDEIELAVAAAQAARGPQANISYIAFTATPRNVTLERFGTKDAGGLPRPFHLHSMRQTIEDGFILDVLRSYMTCQAYYELEKRIENDPAFERSRASARVARFARLHETALAQKAEVIVDHFRRHVLPELGGAAKAMIVTSSREHAVRRFGDPNSRID